MSRTAKKPYRAIGVCIILLLVTAVLIPAATGSDVRSRREYTRNLGIHLNPMLLESTSYPGAHTVSSISIDVMILDGIDHIYIQQALAKVNPFWQFKIVPPDASKYHSGIDTKPEDCVDVNGLAISSYENVLVIGKDTYTHGIGKPGPSVFINPANLPSTDSLKMLIEHELSHQIGNPDVNDAPETTQMIENYIDDSKTAGAVTVNVYSGNDPNDWKSWTVYM